MAKTKRTLTGEQEAELIKVLKARFEKNMKRHKDISWTDVEKKLQADSEKLWCLQQMEISGGEPDVVGYNKEKGMLIFFDCAAESPKGRRSLCYDREALDSRKEAKPVDSAMDVAEAMGAEILDENQYHRLQELGEFDAKTSSWLRTPANVRSLGGAIFGDYRFGRVFIYHNGASSYYAARGFRCSLMV